MDTAASRIRDGATSAATEEHSAGMSDAAPDDSESLSDDWHAANQRYLTAALAVVGCLLDRAESEPAAAAQRALEQAEAAMPAPPSLAALAAALRLSPFERAVVLLCAGVELDAAFAARCARAQEALPHRAPTFSLALAALPGAHWSAIGPGGALRRFRLIEVGAGDTLTRSPLRIDERVLHYLVGLHQPDPRLAGAVEPVDAVGELVPSHGRVAEQIAAAWQRAAARGGALPIVQLCGGDPSAKRAVAAAACAALGLSVDAIQATVLGAGVDEAALGHLLEREALLDRKALLLCYDELDGAEAARADAAKRLLARLGGPLIVAARERMEPANRPVIAFDLQNPTTDEQRAVYRAELVGDGEGLGRSELAGVDAAVDRVVAQFDLSTTAIRAACAAAVADGALDPGSNLGATLWGACRARVRVRFDDLAQRVDASATWDDLVLPAPQRAALREIAIHVRQRAKVHDAWGFAKKGARGLGLSALFAGESGTGKTMAAEVLAGELGIDLYRIDLSRVVSKYIGETEKNLRRIFEAAEESAAILLFDEADALFGKRSEVKDSHDRYANIEVSYLLQRIEAYRGLAILTTNLKSALDPAFLRRIRVFVEFPFPSAAQRLDLWRRAYPRETPTEELDFERLSRMNLTGGSIRNIALNAAFCAAEAGVPVRMEHILDAAQGEYAKLERPFIASAR